MRKHPLEGGLAGRRQGSSTAMTCSRQGELSHTRSQRCRGLAGVLIQPFAQRHQAPVASATWRLPSQAFTKAGVAARAADNLAESPAPAEAKCGRPPPFPPLTAAIRFTRSPAFLPDLTRSSVRAT